MQNIDFHLNNILRNYNNLIKICGFLDAKEFEKYKVYLEEKYNSYIKSYITIFNPSKEIKEDMTYFADVRTLAKYNEDIISGWLVEDFFIYIFNLPIFQEHKFLFKIESHDADRIIKKERTFINSDPDFIISHNNLEFKVEVQSLLIPYGKFHIKKNKADRLSNMTSFLYSLLLINQEIIFFYPDDIKTYGLLTKIKAFGGKDGYEYIINSLPKKKKLQVHKLDLKLIITLYWFYFYKKLGKEEFYKFQSELLNGCKSIDDLIKRLKNTK